MRHARTRPWYGVQARGAFKDEAHAHVKGKELKLCDADCFGLVAGFGAEHIPVTYSIRASGFGMCVVIKRDYNPSQAADVLMQVGVPASMKAPVSRSWPVSAFRSNTEIRSES